jgi:hypothetical protein
MPHLPRRPRVRLRSAWTGRVVAMSTCPTYIVPPGFQLSQGGATGPYDCTAWSAAIAIATGSCGKETPSGRIIRLLSDEPVPDPSSPGLNLPQVAAVALDKYGIYLDVRIGSRAVTWAEYEHRRTSGQATLLQGSYAAIAASKYDAGRGFTGGHCIAETTHATYDSLADGRAAGVFRWDGTVYTRAVIQTFAARLDIGGGKHPVGVVWAAFAPDVVPNYRAVIKPVAPATTQAFGTWQVKAGVVQSSRMRTTTGYDDPCTPPMWVKHPDGRYLHLVRVQQGSLAGLYVSASWAQEQHP